jgi:ophiobolin F synthase
MDSTYLPEDLSMALDMSNYPTQGLSQEYVLRRHKFESEADEGIYDARLDWIKYIGRLDEFGSENPINGNYTALCLPLCRPERIQLVSYIVECTLLRVSVRWANF